MKKYLAIFQMQLAHSLAYPLDLVGRSFMTVPFMWIFAQLWTVVYTANAATSLNGLTLAATLWYLMLAETIELSRPRLANTIAEQVKDGSIAYLLNKPMNFLLYHYSSAIAESIFRALMVAFFGSAVVWWMMGAPPSLWGFAAALPAIFGAWTVNFCLSALIGLAAFVTEDVSAFTWIYQKLAFIFGGLLIPLDFYPAWLRAIADALPFQSMVYAPARLFVEPSIARLVSVLGSQLLWSAALSLLLLWAYKQGERWLTVNGG